MSIKGFRGLELMMLQYIYNLKMRIYLVMNIKIKFDMPVDTEEALVLGFT
jgi:hypothetical protein